MGVGVGGEESGCGGGGHMPRLLISFFPKKGSEGCVETTNNKKMVETNLRFVAVQKILCLKN